jgi:flavin reductase (DIM6/NTAB) family NADH-FMN oxidoreductase RutF
VEPDPLAALTDPMTLRRAFGAFATGVTVLTVGEPTPHGMTANSFTTVSLDPPLVLVCVDRSAIMHRALAQTTAFGVSVLADHQEGIARYFADRRRPLGGPQFEAVDWRPGPVTGVPLITEALAQFECRPWRRYDGGDHSIVVGVLAGMHREGEENALLFHHGQFGRLQTQPSEVSA